MGLPGMIQVHPMPKCHSRPVPYIFLAAFGGTAQHERNNPMDAIGVRIVDNATVLPRETG
jgi:hypothetical protein